VDRVRSFSYEKKYPDDIMRMIKRIDAAHAVKEYEQVRKLYENFEPAQLYFSSSHAKHAQA